MDPPTPPTTLHQALDAVSDLVSVISRDWTLVHTNATFERMAGQPRASVIGHNLWEAFPHIVGTKFETEARAAMESGQPRVYEEKSPRDDRWMQMRAFPFAQGLVILTTDITQRKRDEITRAEIEEKLLQGQRMELLGTLAGGIAHDFNNILGAILGHVGLLREQLSPADPLRESIDQIGIAGSRARDLVQQILTFSRASTREFTRQPLRPLVEESLRLLHSTLPATAQLHADLTDEPLAATVNPSEVQQVMLNLCTNAWQALADGRGHIDVVLRCVELERPMTATVGRLLPGRYACISVRDDGRGMDEATQQRLFEPFFTTKPRGQGTGLGLHVLRGIVTAHGGAIDVDTAPGAGARFTVYLLSGTEADPRPAAKPAVARPNGAGGRVAYLDDDEVVILMVERVLERSGYQPTTFLEPEAFLAALSEDPGRYDLLVTDHSMPRMTGLEVARQAATLAPALPVIVSSGFVSDALRVAADELGVRAILHKENTYEDLGTLCAEVLAAVRSSAA